MKNLKLNKILNSNIFKSGHKINFINLKYFGSRYKTTVKPIDNNEEIKLNKKENIGYIDEKLIKNKSEFDKFTDPKLIEFNKELKNIILNLQDSPKGMFIWYTFHIAPCILFINSVTNILWMFQIFWTGTSIGLAYSSYEFYSNLQEKKILDNHILFGTLLCIFIIILAVFNKLFQVDRDLKALLNFVNILNFLSVYFLISGKKKQFFIPKWFKFSQRKFTLLMILLGLIGNNIEMLKNGFNFAEDKSLIIDSNEVLQITQEHINLIHYRYLKEFSSIYF